MCFQRHVNTILVLGRCVFNWLQFIPNSYNFIFQINIKIVEKKKIKKIERLNYLLFVQHVHESV